MSLHPSDTRKTPRRLPDFSRIEIEDGAPVESRFQELQMRLLTESLQVSWPPMRLKDGRQAEVFADVGLFYDPPRPPIVPDVMLSLDLEPIPQGTTDKGYNTYSVPHRGKPPDLCIEIVSNRKGKEYQKLDTYAEAGVPYVVIFDPKLRTSRSAMRAYTLHDGAYLNYVGFRWFEELGIGLALWQGSYGPFTTTWLRWCDADGTILPTGEELSQAERQRADAERARAEAERKRADKEQQQAQAERQRADEERQQAQAERQRADEEQQRAHAERIRAEEERQRADAERQRADAAAAELARIRAELERVRGSRESG
jgi:Uma2 family endonuclease